MDWLESGHKIKAWLNRYKFVALILSIGILMMVQPGKTNAEAEPADRPLQVQQPDLTEKLTEILGQIHGVGKVRVMITEAAGAETVYQTDEDRSVTADATTVRLETILISSGGAEQGLVKTVTPPVYLGAVIVCQGGDNPTVRLAVSQAVSSLTGIGTDHITVLKMK